MSGLATAIVVGGAYTADQNNKAAGKAIDAQQAATNQSAQVQREVLDFQKEMYGQQREDMKPWLEAGQNSLTSMLDMMNNPNSMEAIQNDPAYQFRMAEGSKAIERSAAARGGLSSGGTLKALTRYGQGVASDEYNNRWNRLAGIAGVGQSAASNNAAAAGQMGQNMGQYGNNLTGLYTNMANANASAHMNQAANNAGFVNNAVGAVGYTISDVNEKTNIKPIPKKDIEEFKAVIKPYFYEYKNKEIAVGEFAGIMAQDLEKTRLGKMAVFKDDKGRKVVDFNKLMPIFIASMAEGA